MNQLQWGMDTLALGAPIRSQCHCERKCPVRIVSHMSPVSTGIINRYIQSTGNIRLNILLQTCQIYCLYYIMTDQLYPLSPFHFGHCCGHALPSTASNRRFPFHKYYFILLISNNGISMRRTYQSKTMSSPFKNYYSVWESLNESSSINFFHNCVYICISSFS